MFTRTPLAVASEAVQRRRVYRIVGRPSPAGRLAALSAETGLIAYASIRWRSSNERREP